MPLENFDLSTYKRLERQVYDEHYTLQKPFDDIWIRKFLLKDSEEYFLQKLLKLIQGKRVLEIGCGTGTHAELMAKHAKLVVGIDISIAGLHKATQRIISTGISPCPYFAQMDIENLSFSSESFDVIVDHEAFSSISLENVFPELHRVLVADGILIGIETFGHNVLFNFRRRIKMLLGRRTKWASQHILRLEHFEQARLYFPSISANYFHFLALFCSSLRYVPIDSLRTLLLKCISQMDKFIFATNWTKLLAFKVVFELRKQAVGNKQYS